MNKHTSEFQIGDIVEIKAQIVDYNDGDEKAKLKVLGYAENKNTLTERYIWVNYADVKNSN